jgi:hypothetical protein
MYILERYIIHLITLPLIIQNPLGEHYMHFQPLALLK